MTGLPRIVQPTEPRINYQPDAHARASDPITSHEAAESIKPESLPRRHVEILRLFREEGPMTQEELVRRADRDNVAQSPSGLRTRVSELVATGELVNTGRTVVLRSGRKAIIWSLPGDQRRGLEEIA